jgi:hypothetical protein
MKLKVLIACEESQTTCKAFRELGHEAYSCDLQDCSGGHPEWHLKQDVLPLLEEDWDLIIAHPPCTYMSNAGACRMFPKAGEISKERFEKAMEAKAFFMKFYNCKCRYVAIENPIPLHIVGLPQASQVIQPYEFGEPFSKATLLWLKNLPPLFPTGLMLKHTPWIASNTGRFSRGGNGHRGNAFNTRKRSKTFEGIAKAFASQWGAYVVEQKGK